ncbi:RlpA-like double-psi beta-barrel-protein domain-containing protein-containing protein [Mycena vitilis]|nr:RlpA-like double-psi beta-barrel-protein domain-containing protein-containing protein [Mycena vitilis]
MFSTILLLSVLAAACFEISAEAHAMNVALQRRYDNARFTFFDAGLGACGSYSSASDFIVALNAEQYGDGEHCYEMIEITYNGKTARAQIVDECPECAWGALDFSTSLFDHFASEDKGVLYGSWVFADQGGDTTTQETTTRPTTRTTTRATTKTTTSETTKTTTRETTTEQSTTQESTTVSKTSKRVSTQAKQSSSSTLASTSLTPTSTPTPTEASRTTSVVRGIVQGAPSTLAQPTATVGSGAGKAKVHTLALLLGVVMAVCA